MKRTIILITILMITLGTKQIYADTKIINVEETEIKQTDPQIVKNIQEAFDNIQRWVLALSTPAAIIGIGTGVFMKKFSFGEEERIIIGKKLIRNSVFSYAFIVGSGLILQAIRILIGQAK